MIRVSTTLGRLVGAATLALGLSACAADGPPAAPPAAAQTSLGANPAPAAGGAMGGMAGMSHAGMAGMDHSRMTPAQMRTMMAQCDGIRADARRGAALSAERQATLQHCDMMHPAGAAPAGGAPAAHRH